MGKRDIFLEYLENLSKMVDRMPFGFEYTDFFKIRQDATKEDLTEKNK